MNRDAVKVGLKPEDVAVLGAHKSSSLSAFGASVGGSSGVLGVSLQSTAV